MPVEPRVTPKRSVLIVDDDHSALEAMEAALCKEFHVLSADDVSTADGILKKQAVDLVILDVFLPGEGGIGFLDRLGETSAVPVLLISGYGTKEMIIEGLRARASDYLDKPFTATMLLDRARLLSRKISVAPRSHGAH